MDKIRDYFETNFKLAYKSVTFHFKQFVWFYLALFVVQLLLGVFSTSVMINEKNAKNSIEDKYSSHYVFYYMNENQRIYLEKAASYYFKSEYFFDIKQIKEYGNVGDPDYKCDVYVTFTGDPVAGYERFSYKFLHGLSEYGNVNSSPTPLFELQSYINRTRALYNTYIILTSVLAFLILAVLYNIRTNNFRFDYGIYMAFGADKKKLFNTSFWEMTVIAILTFLPASILTVIFNLTLSFIKGSSFVFGFRALLQTLVLTLIINVFAVLFSIAKTALKRPISLITAKDNSNLVISPRVSVDILIGRRIGKLIRLSMRRYFKYYSVLIVSAVIFTVLFVCSVFCSALYSQKQTELLPQYEIKFDSSIKYSEEDRNDLLAFEGVTETYKEQSMHIMAMKEHILIDKSNAKITANRVVADEENIAMDNVMLYAADSEVIDYLEKHSDYSGDLRSILNTPNTIIITESFNNTTHFEFAPGDKITLADYYTRISEPDMYFSGKDLLRERLKYYVFLYKEVTVGAVIHNSLSDENLKIYMGKQLYEDVTEQTVRYDTVYLYTDPELTNTDHERLYSNLLKFTEMKYRGDRNTNLAFVKNLYKDVYSDIELKTHLPIKLIVIAFSLLLISCLVWFFSQMLFYKKRTNEFTVLRSIGMTMGEIKKIIFTEAAIISLVSLAVYALLSYLFSFGLYKFMNSWLFMYSFRYSFSMPYTAILIGAAATLIFAFCSTFLPYIRYKRSIKTTVPET